MKKRKVQIIQHLDSHRSKDDVFSSYAIAQNRNELSPALPAIAGGLLGYLIGTRSSSASPILEGDGVVVVATPPFTGGYTPVPDENGTIVAMNSRKSIIVTEDDVYSYLNAIIGTGSAPFFYRLGACIRTGIVLDYSKRISHTSTTKKHGLLCSYSQKLTYLADRSHSIAPGTQAIEFNSSIMSVSSAYLDQDSSRQLAKEFSIFKKNNANFKRANVVSDIARCLSLVSSIVVNSEGDTIATMMPNTEAGIVADIAGFFDKSMMPASLQTLYDFEAFCIMHNPASSYFTASFRSSNDANFAFEEYSAMKQLLSNI